MSNVTKIEERPQVLCAPTLIFTQADANYVASLCPYHNKEGKQNIVFVMGGMTKESIEKREGRMYVIHHTKDEKTGEEKVESEWEYSVPVVQDKAHKNQFHTAIKFQ
jgi:hypothetical protein